MNMLGKQFSETFFKGKLPMTNVLSILRPNRAISTTLIPNLLFLLLKPLKQALDLERAMTSSPGFCLVKYD